MSRQLANHLKSYGRDGDTELVHMTKGEIKGLQELAMAHGGSLSINPDTGLVEAGWLKNLLPTIAGAALTAATGGAAAPWMIGLGYGAFEAARTGDISKGLTAGLGAYGGAGLTSGLTSAAASAAPTATGISAGAPAATSAVTSAAPTAVGSTAGIEGASQALSSGSTMAPSAGSTFGSIAPPPAGSTFGSIAPPSTPMASTPTPSMSNMDIAKYGMAAASPVIAAASEVKPPVEEMEDPRYAGAPYKYNLSPDFRGYVPRQPKPYYRPAGLGYAEGGQVDQLEQMAPGGLAAIQGMRDGYAPSMTSYGEMPQYAEGGSIGGYSDGGRMLKGPGDGMSDSIPGVIGSKQPARLADGEFVVPADVVSHLGNGSTDAGAKRLYGMLDKVRTARTGTKKQGKQIKADKFLPKFADGGDVAAPTTAVSTQSAPQYQPGRFTYNPQILSDYINGVQSAPASAGLAQQVAYDPYADLQAKLASAKASRPVVEATKLNTSDNTLGSEWELYNSPAAGWTKFLSSGRLSSVANPPLSNPNSYTDAQGRIWVKKGTTYTEPSTVAPYIGSSDGG